MHSFLFKNGFRLLILAQLNRTYLSIALRLHHELHLPNSPFQEALFIPQRDTTSLTLLNKTRYSSVSELKPPLSNLSLQSMGTNGRNDAGAHILAVKNVGEIKASQGR